MVRAELRMTLPSDVWIARVSRSVPDAEYRMLGGMPTADGSMELGEVSGPDPRKASMAVEADDAVHSFDLLGVDDDRALAAYRTTSRRLYELAQSVALPLEYPIAVSDGDLTLAVETTREALRRMTAELDDRGVPYELLSLTATADDAAGDVLTERQRELLRTAWERGYYAVPRECALADVAAAVDVDPSTASTVLRRAEARLVGAHLDGGR